MTERWRGGVRIAAVVAPIVVAAPASLLDAVVTSTGAALILVLVVVAVAASGDRLAGVVGALVAAASFDWFLTVPYHQFAIFSRDDLETAVLLLAIGLGVTEIAQWGRRQQASSSRRQGYLAGVAHVAALAAEGRSPRELVATIEAMILDVLDLDTCRYVPPGSVDGDAGDRPVIARDGSVRWDGRTVDVRREGLPGLDAIVLPAGRAQDSMAQDSIARPATGSRGCGGYFLLTASTEVRRPDREELLVAVTLAEQVTGPETTTEPDRRESSRREI